MHKSAIDRHVSILGRRVEDKVTGFVGVVESISFDLYGCVQCVVKPPMREGDVKEGRWFDIQRLTVLEGDSVMPMPDFERLLAADGTHAKGPSEKPARERA